MKIVFFAAALLVADLAAARAAEPAQDNSQTIGGRGFVFRYGNAYEVINGRERFVKTLYDPDFTARNYRAAGGKVLARVADGEWAPVLRTFREGFESTKLLRKLIGPGRGWTAFTLQSPLAPKAADYIALRENIMEGNADFLDNRLEPVAAAARGGKAGLRAYAVPPTEAMGAAKASLDTGLLYLRQGDDFWFSGWFKIVQGSPGGLLDLESAYIDENPGLTLRLSDTLEPRMDFTWGDKPSYAAAKDVRLPRGRWFRLTLHLKLYSDPRGRVELWLGPQKVIDAAGQTLPLPDTVLNRLELGITALTAGGNAELHLDDIAFGPAKTDVTP